jgi:hypothetical protein
LTLYTQGPASVFFCPALDSFSSLDYVHLLDRDYSPPGNSATVITAFARGVSDHVGRLRPLQTTYNEKKAGRAFFTQMLLFLTFSIPEEHHAHD